MSDDGSKREEYPKSHGRGRHAHSDIAKARAAWIVVHESCSELADKALNL